MSIQGNRPQSAGTKRSVLGLFLSFDDATEMFTAEILQRLLSETQNLARSEPGKFAPFEPESLAKAAEHCGADPELIEKIRASRLPIMFLFSDDFEGAPTVKDAKLSEPYPVIGLLALLQQPDEAIWFDLAFIDGEDVHFLTYEELLNQSAKFMRHNNRVLWERGTPGQGDPFSGPPLPELPGDR